MLTELKTVGADTIDPSRRLLDEVLNQNLIGSPNIQRLLQLESLLGAAATAVIGGACGGFHGGTEITAVLFNRVTENLRQKDAPVRIARTTAVTLARVNGFNQLVAGLQEQGIIQIPEGIDQGRIFTLTTDALQRIIATNIAAMQAREDIARAELPAVRAETNLLIARVENAGRRAAVYPRVLVTETLGLAGAIIGKTVTDLTEWIEKGGRETLKTTGRFLGGIIGIAVAFPHAAIGLGAEFLPDAAIPTAIGTFAGALFFAVSALRNGYTISDEVFREDTITGGFIGLLAGTIFTIVASRLTRGGAGGRPKI